MKIKSEWSGKNWDAAMKGLVKYRLLKLRLVGESKIVEITGIVFPILLLTIKTSFESQGIRF
ncbi:hypothetical protein [Flavobacterium sp.]|uniref:hypothetical protein n=1 Tax=Flavobacterium sp. TaxID=239 RepID=UPI0037BEE362